MYKIEWTECVEKLVDLDFIVLFISYRLNNFMEPFTVKFLFNYKNTNGPKRFNMLFTV